MPRLMKMGLISGKPANLDTRYVPGSGVGASSSSNRRALVKRANKAVYVLPDTRTSDTCGCKLSNPADLAHPYTGSN